MWPEDRDITEAAEAPAWRAAAGPMARGSLPPAQDALEPDSRKTEETNDEICRILF